jgi:hypothetical protein
MAYASLFVGLVLWVGIAAGTLPQPSKVLDGGVDQASIQQTVEALGSVLTREYFDPAVAARVSEALQKRLAEGGYQKFPTVEALAKALTDDLYAMTKDKHLSVSPAVEVISSLKGAAAVDDTPREVIARRANFGVRRLEILPGNVGYLQFTAFYRPDEAREVIASAMATLRHTDALILDLRENGGGSTETMALVASYFYEAQGLPLFAVFPRPPAKVAKFMTEATPLPDRNERRPTYVLVSGNTWSGGEGLAFILQDRHRAEVIGEPTAGAGNQARPHRLNAQFEATIPNGSVRSAIRNQSWEGTGVVPDIPAIYSNALRVAHALALQRLMENTPRGPWHDALEKHLGSLKERRD